MNDLEHLRSTLDTHADAVSGGEAHARITAVHHRVRAARNRRRAAVAGGAVAVLAVVGGVAALPDGDPAPEPASRIVGVQPPAQMTALGFTYELSDGVEGTDGRAVLRLEASDDARLVSWATSSDDDTVRVTTDDLSGGEGDTVTYTDADFTNWTTVTEGFGATITVTTADGEPGIAVYTLGDERPAGVTDDGVTFREEIAQGRLVDAAIGEAGQSELTVSGGEPGQRVQYTYYCVGGPSDAYVRVEDARGELISEGPGCDDTLLADPAATGGGGTSRPGAAQGARIAVTEGRGGAPVDSPDLRVGIGMYAMSGADRFVSRTFESDGHVWTRVDLQSGSAADGRLVATAPSGLSAVLALAESTPGAGFVRIRFAGHPGEFNTNAGGGTWETVSPGAQVSLRSTNVRGPDAELRVAFYERAD